MDSLKLVRCFFYDTFMILFLFFMRILRGATETRVTLDLRAGEYSVNFTRLDSRCTHGVAYFLRRRKILDDDAVKCCHWKINGVFRINSTCCFCWFDVLARRTMFDVSLKIEYTKFQVDEWRDRSSVTVWRNSVADIVRVLSLGAWRTISSKYVFVRTFLHWWNEWVSYPSSHSWES